MLAMGCAGGVCVGAMTLGGAKNDAGICANPWEWRKEWQKKENPAGGAAGQERRERRKDSVMGFGRNLVCVVFVPLTFSI